MLANANLDWQKEYISIEKKIADNSILATFKSVGGYSGECVILDLSNNTDQEQKIVIEAGDKLMCENENMQNIFITQTDYLVIAPKSTKRKKVFGFCCSHDKSAPLNQVAFNYDDNKISNELKLATYLNNHRQIDINAVQYAVWIVCNDVSMDGIYADDLQSVQELKKTVAEITGKEIPWYTKKYDVDSTGRLLESCSKLIAEMNFNLNKETIITVQICSDKDVVLKIPLQEKLLQRGHYDYQFTWDTNKLPKGKYYARIFSDGQMIQEKELFL